MSFSSFDELGRTIFENHYQKFRMIRGQKTYFSYDHVEVKDDKSIQLVLNVKILTGMSKKPVRERQLFYIGNSNYYFRYRTTVFL